MSKDLLLIILGATVCGAYYAFLSFIRKKEEKRQDRLNRIKVDNNWLILYNTGQKARNYERYIKKRNT